MGRTGQEVEETDGVRMGGRQDRREAGCVGGKLDMRKTGREEGKTGGRQGQLEGRTGKSQNRRWSNGNRCRTGV